MKLNQMGGGYDLFMAALLCLPIFFFFIFSILSHKHRSQFSGTNSHPGNIGYPIVGETLQFISSARKGFPEKFFLDRMAEHGSQLFKTSIIGIPVTVFCGPSSNKFFFSNETKLVEVWWPDSFHKLFPSTTQTSTIEEGKKFKKLLPQFLKPEALKRYVGIMDAAAQQHLASFWENKDRVVVLPLAKKFTLMLSFRLFLSYDDTKKTAKLVKPLRDLTDGIFSFPLNLPGTSYGRAIKASNQTRKELSAIVEQRKAEIMDGVASPTQDILSHMLTTTENGFPFVKDPEIVDMIIAVIIGSYETTSSIITFIIKFLAEHTHVYESVYKEQMEIAKSKGPGEPLTWEDIQKMKYSWNVACETLRLVPPVQGTFRKVIKEFTFNGFSFPKEWKVYWNTNSTHKNHDYFPDPHKFDPTRFEGNGPAPFTFVPFGGGLRMCPGNEYARLQILVFMYNLVRRFKWELVYPNETITYFPAPVLTKGLPIRLIPHKAI